MGGRGAGHRTSIAARSDIGERGRAAWLRCSSPTAGAMAPWGGKTRCSGPSDRLPARFRTRADRRDLSLSKVARGNVMAAARRASVPNAGARREGRATTDATPAAGTMGPLRRKAPHGADGGAAREADGSNFAPRRRAISTPRAAVDYRAFIIARTFRVRERIDGLRCSRARSKTGGLGMRYACGNGPRQKGSQSRACSQRQGLDQHLETLRLVVMSKTGPGMI